MSNAVEIDPFCNEPPSAPTYTAEQIEARVDVIRKVRDSWKGKSEYAATIDMEIWALSLAAKVIRTDRLRYFD